MHHQKILTRAWTMLWHYRALWLFGFLFVLTGGGGGLTLYNGGSSGRSSNNNNGDFPGNGGWPNFHFGEVNWGAVALIIGIVLIVLLVLWVITLVIRYLAETALLAGVNEIESTGAPFTVREGLRLGRSRQAWQLFLTDVVISVPLTVGALALLALAAAPLLLWLTTIVPLGILASLISGGLLLLVIAGLIAVSLGLSLVMPYIRRRVVLDKLGVLAAIRQSVQLVRASLIDTGLMWLLLAGIRIVWTLVMFPIVIVLVVLATVIGGVPAGLAYLLSHSWVWPMLVGLPLFLLTLIPALAFVGGLFEVYTSAAWTLTYREAAGKYAPQLTA